MLGSCILYDESARKLFERNMMDVSWDTSQCGRFIGHLSLKYERLAINGSLELYGKLIKA